MNAVLLTGSLAVISGGVMTVLEVAGDSEDSVSRALAVGFLVLGGLHLYFDRIFRHAILIVLGLFLCVAVFPATAAVFLAGHNLPVDVWTAVGIATGGVTAIAGHLGAQTTPERRQLRSSFLSIAGFIVLCSVYAASVGSDAAVLWNITLPLFIYTAFYLSIRWRSKNFLVTGSFFLVLYIITVAFKYFSGFGAAFSLLISATALLATAFMASSINSRYIKTRV